MGIDGKRVTGGGWGPLEDVFLGLELAMGGETETFAGSCGWDGSQGAGLCRAWLMRTRLEVTWRVQALKPIWEQCERAQPPHDGMRAPRGVGHS